MSIEHYIGVDCSCHVPLVRYNMEWKRREAFVAPALLASSWRGRVNMSVGMAQVQVAVLLHTYAVVWVLLQTWHA